VQLPTLATILYSGHEFLEYLNYYSENYKLKIMATTTAYRKSEISGIPQGASIDNSFWNYFLLLENDFENTLRYIHLDNSNFSTFSLEYVKQIVCIATEFETILKLMCKEINDSNPGNMGEYKEIILSKFPKIWSTPVFLDSQTQIKILPLQSWEKEGGKLEWWDVYNDLKHKRYLHFESATLETTLNALGSLLIVEVYLYRIAYPSPKNFKFGTSLFRTPSLAEPLYLSKGELPDFET
jgi:hypothetical protein